MTNDEISRTIEEKTMHIAEEVVDRQYRLQPDIWKRYGEAGRQTSIRDVTYHIPYLTEAIRASDSSMFVNYVLWVKELFAGLGFPDTVLPATLECMRNVLNETLPREMAEVAAEYIGGGLQKVGEVSEGENTFMPEGVPYADQARIYLDMLLNGKRNDAAKLIMDMVEDGVSIQDIYMNVFQASQYEIGRLWHTKKVTVAQEHYCSAATERIMSQLYTRIFTTERIGKSYVGACVGGELHQIGARMVADFFEMDGWDTYYMGANTPAQSILQAISDHGANILGISCSMSFHRSTLEELIENVRKSDDTPDDFRIMVGGYYFIKNPGLWKQVGADASASNAGEALSLAKELTTQTGHC